jgi:carbamate kinase
MATDVDAVYRDFGTPDQVAVRGATPDEIRDMDLPAGSMGPKVEAAIAFAEHTGKPAAIGRLAEIGQVIAGERGTRIELAPVTADQS